MAYDPLTGVYTPDPVKEGPLVAYQPESGKTISGYSTISDYVNASVAAAPPTKAPTRTPIYDSKGKLIGYNVTTYNPDGSIASVKFEAAGDNKGTGTGNIAYDTISKILESYNITGLASVLEDIRKEYPEAGSADILTLLQFDDRYNAKFNERFSANAIRQKAGMKVLSPAEYLALEQGYKKTFSAYDLKTFANQDYYNKLIASDVSTTELTDRVTLAFDRVLNDQPVQTAFKKFYPSLTTSDIVTAMLDPVNQFPALERKVKAAEVGGAALRQGLYASELTTTPITSTEYTNVTTGTVGADVLAQQGVTKAQAETGYQKIAQILPTADKLSSIYGGTMEQYGRLQAEEEQFQGLASAARKRQRLSELEIAQFKKSSGLGKGALGTITNI